MRPIYQLENFDISLDENIPAVISKAVGYPKSSSQLQNAFKHVLLACERNVETIPGLNLMLDLSEAGGATSEDSEWVMSYLNPKLDDAGIRKMAIISPVEEYAQISVSEYMDLPSTGQMQLRLFGKVELAKDWLKEI